jgi:molybdenum ABC transporter molybdate-binding protein
MKTTNIRCGSIHATWLMFLASAGALGGLVGLLYLIADNGPSNVSTGPLIVYCAAGIKEPVEKVANEYTQAYGVPVQLQYGGSQTLLANIEVSKRGDLYLPADDYYIQLARDKKLVDEAIALAKMTPVIAVPQGNPKKIQSLADLLTGNSRISQANPDAAAVGKLTRDALQPAGQWDALKQKTVVFKPTVNDVANDIKVGAADAGIVWDATVRQMAGLEMIAAPELSKRSAHISISVLSGSTQPTAALRFARYLAARDKGLTEFEKTGFQPAEGDVWAEHPKLRVFAGAMLKPAIEQTIMAFEQREGVKVDRVYDGCGNLVAGMRGGARPDAYFACEKSFMKQVNDLFLDSVDVSSNQLVIVVHKGNPHQIKTLKDLGKPGIRVGVGHEQQCALGVITQQALKEGGAHQPVMKNVKVQLPTGDGLVNQLRAGKLDAVIAYISNAHGAGDEVEAFSVEDIPCATAIQPIAVGKASPNKQLAGRLMDAIRSSESQKQFQAYGFGWKDTKK